MSRRAAHSSPLVRRAGWVIGAVVGALVAGGVGSMVWDSEQERAAEQWEKRQAAHARVEQVPPPADVVSEIAAQDRAVVMPARIAGRVDPQVREQAEAALAGVEVPVRLAYLPAPTLHNGYTSSGAPAMWAEAVGEEGFYVVVYDDGSAEVTSPGYEEPYLYDIETKGQPGPVLLRTAQAAAEWVPERDVVRPPSDFDYWDGWGGGIAAAGLFGLFVVVPIFLGLRLLVKLLRKDA